MVKSKNLPNGHKIARGRARRKQLDKMTEEQKEEEHVMRKEEMRLAAQRFRTRRKERHIFLENSNKIKDNFLIAPPPSKFE